MNTPVTIFVCNNCGMRKGEEISDGKRLYNQVSAGLSGTKEVRVREVKCLGGCQHPCAMAFVAPGKFTYLYGDFRPQTDDKNLIQDIKSYALSFANSQQGLVPKDIKPECFKKILVRIPHPTWEGENGQVVFENNLTKPDMEPGASEHRRSADH